MLKPKILRVKLKILIAAILDLGFWIRYYEFSNSNIKFEIRFKFDSNRWYFTKRQTNKLKVKLNHKTLQKHLQRPFRQLPLHKRV